MPAAGIPAGTADVPLHNPAVGSSEQPDRRKWPSSSQPLGKALGFPHCGRNLPLAMASGGQTRCWQVTVPACGPRCGQKCGRRAAGWSPGYLERLLHRVNLPADGERSLHLHPLAFAAGKFSGEGKAKRSQHIPFFLAARRPKASLSLPIRLGVAHSASR